MSLGLRLLATLPDPAPIDLLEQIENWIHREHSSVLPKTRQGAVDNTPTLFCQFHPAAEEVEISRIDMNHIVVSANTTTVGPGYHIFVCTLLKQMTREFNISWEQSKNSSDDFGDETEYFFTGDEQTLYDNMHRWLKALAGAFFDGTLETGDLGIALCLPMNPQFESEAMAKTPLGPRDRDWLYRTSQDGASGRDFFAWYKPGTEADYYLGRALAQMWTDVRWRPPINDFERDGLRHIADCLRSAYEIDPTLAFPWAEWAQILDYLDEDQSQRAFVALHDTGKSTIGYRRRNVTESLPGGWTIRIPGSFSDFEPDEENNLCAVDSVREIWFTSYRYNPGFLRKTYRSLKKEMKEAKHDYLIEYEDQIAHAMVTEKQKEDGGTYFIFQGFNLTMGQRSVCTIVFPNLEWTEAALNIWRSIKPRQTRKSR